MDLHVKVKNLFDFKSWLENFVGKMLMTKAVKHAVAGIVGLVSGLGATALLAKFGVTIDPTHLTEGLTVLFTGLAGSVMNWAIKVMYKDAESKA